MKKNHLSIAQAHEIPDGQARLIMGKCIVCHLYDEVLKLPLKEGSIRVCASCAGRMLGAFRQMSSVPKKIQ